VIQLTRRDGSLVHLNPDTIEIIEETPDTHITLTNGNRYLVLESAAVITDRIIAFKGKILRRGTSHPVPRHVHKRLKLQLHPFCDLKLHQMALQDD
jgi:flagellar protein FlbD